MSLFSSLEHKLQTPPLALAFSSLGVNFILGSHCMSSLGSGWATLVHLGVSPLTLNRGDK